MDAMDIIITIIQFAVGLGVLLYGVNLLSSGLEKNMGTALRKKLEKISENPVKGAGLGFGITAVLQSSNASSVMVVGLTSAKILSLSQATAILIGAKLGSTIPMLLLSFSFLKITDILQLAVFVGAIMYLFSKKQKFKNFGLILIGFGLMFVSLYLMSQSTAGFRQIDGFDKFLGSITNPIVLIAIGLIFTLIIQSNLGLAAILITLVTPVGGIAVMSVQSAAFIVFGGAIGSTATSILASLGGSVNARRVAFINLFIRLFGLVILAPLTYFIPWVNWLISAGVAPSLMIFLINFIFGVICLALLPFTNQVVWISKKVFKKEDLEAKTEVELIFGIDAKISAMPTIALQMVQKGMITLVEKMGIALNEAVDIVQNKGTSRLFVEHINKAEIKYHCEVLNNYVPTLYWGLIEREITLAQNYQSIITDVSKNIDLFVKTVRTYREYDQTKGVKDERATYIQDIMQQIRFIGKACIDVVKQRAAGETGFEKTMVEFFEADAKINEIKTALKKRNIAKLKSHNGEYTLHNSLFYNVINYLDEISEILTKISLTTI